MFNGDKLKITLFGESHGRCVGVCIEGLPYGLRLDMDKIAEFSRRRRGIDSVSTGRREPDEVEIMSGVMDGVTTGGGLCAMIFNRDTRSKDYRPDIPRPSHADYAAKGRYGGFNDYRGGGMFSGRLTAPLVFAGAVCDTILEQKGVITGVHVLGIHNVCDSPIDMVKVDAELLRKLNAMDIPVITDGLEKEMINAVLAAKAEGDSLGGILEFAAVGYPPFIGGNYFDRLNSKLAGLIFSLPAFCALEFGGGFDMARRTGFEVNDSLYYDGDEVKTLTNNSGGINGGITNGMPIILRCAVKPTPSVYKSQKTIDMNSKTNIEHMISGRHDPCIALRAGIVLRSMVNIGLCDSILQADTPLRG